MSFVAWSTPFLKTDQNEPVSPCVTTATLIVPAFVAPKAAAAGVPNAVRPAAARPPLTRRPRRESGVPSIVSRTSSFIVFPSPLSGSTPVLRFSTRECLCASHLLDRDGTPLGPGAVGGERDEQRGAGFLERARAFPACPNRSDERRELGAIRRREALEEVAVAGSGRRRAGLDGANGAARVDADGDAVRRPEDLEPDVVAERIVARSREDPERAAAQPEHRDRSVDVAVTLEPRRLAYGAIRIDLEDLLTGDVANGVEVVDMQVAEDAA